jgi:GR25 family glycosyltransferase involved in LPS biosynthesis
MKGAAKFENNLNPVVAITENDDVVFLQDFEEAPTDRSKAIIHLDGLYAFIKEKVNQDG